DLSGAEDALRPLAQRQRTEAQLAGRASQHEGVPLPGGTVIEEDEARACHSHRSNCRIRSGTCFNISFRSAVRSRGATKVTPPLRTTTRSLAPKTTMPPSSDHAMQSSQSIKWASPTATLPR